MVKITTWTEIFNAAIKNTLEAIENNKSLTYFNAMDMIRETVNKMPKAYRTKAGQMIVVTKRDEFYMPVKWYVKY